MHRQLRVYIAVSRLSRLTYLRKVYLESSECVKPERAIKPRHRLWALTDRIATFSSAIDVLPRFDFLTQM
jgi:hypothetical protein